MSMIMREHQSEALCELDQYTGGLMLMQEHPPKAKREHEHFADVIMLVKVHPKLIASSSCFKA